MEKVILRNQACTSHRPVRAWLKNEGTKIWLIWLMSIFSPKFICQNLNQYTDQYYLHHILLHLSVMGMSMWQEKCQSWSNNGSLQKKISSALQTVSKDSRTLHKGLQTLRKGSLARNVVTYFKLREQMGCVIIHYVTNVFYCKVRYVYKCSKVEAYQSQTSLWAMNQLVNWIMSWWLMKSTYNLSVQLLFTELI